MILFPIFHPSKLTCVLLLDDASCLGTIRQSIDGTASEQLSILDQSRNVKFGRKRLAGSASYRIGNDDTSQNIGSLKE
jgi:hypothetical protein